MTLSRRFADAMVFAHDLHQGQVRKGGPVPYISHVMGVASLVLDFGGNEDEAIGALLHDTVEDAPRSRPRIKDEIGAAFGPAVLQIVLDCSDTDVHPKPPWRERKKAYIEHLPGVGRSSKLVSAADKLHNCRAIHLDFGRIGDEDLRPVQQGCRQAGHAGLLPGARRHLRRHVPAPGERRAGPGGGGAGARCPGWGPGAMAPAVTRVSGQWSVGSSGW